MRALEPVAETPDSLRRDVADEVVPATRRTKVIGLGTVLMLVGPVLIYNFGLTSLLHSPQVRQYNLTDPGGPGTRDRRFPPTGGLVSGSVDVRSRRGVA